MGKNIKLVDTSSKEVLYPQTKASLLLNDDGSKWEGTGGAGGAGDKASVVDTTLKFEQAVESKVVVANNSQATTESLNELKVGDVNYKVGGACSKTETWTFILDSGETITKEVGVK